MYVTVLTMGFVILLPVDGLGDFLLFFFDGRPEVPTKTIMLSIFKDFTNLTLSALSWERSYRLISQSKIQ